MRMEISDQFWPARPRAFLRGKQRRRIDFKMPGGVTRNIARAFDPLHHPHLAKQQSATFMGMRRAGKFDHIGKMLA